MKKLILIIFLIFNFQTGIVVHANVVCTATDFSLLNIVGHNQFETLGCYATFVAAQTAMNEMKVTLPDLIITHESSPSPSKIISATRAVVSTYPYRLRASTFRDEILGYIFRQPSLTGDSTYMPAFHDARYFETVSYNPTQNFIKVDVNGNIEDSTGFDPNAIAYSKDITYNQRGSVKIEISGFVGYMNVAAVDIIPIIYLENNWTMSLGGKTYLETQMNIKEQNRELYRNDTYPIFPYNVRARINEYRVGDSREIVHDIFSTFTGNSRGPYVYGPAPDWLVAGRYYSADGIRFYNDIALTQPVLNGETIGEYYQYFQYLPFRSTSNVNGNQFDSYLEAIVSNPQRSAMYRTGQFFVNAQHQLGMNAILVYAMALHESGNGLSTLALTKNNLFGWGAADANPSDAYMFESIEKSIYEHAGLNLRGYLNPNDWRHFGQVLGNKNNGFNTKYASDPYWGQKISGHAYRIDRFLKFIDYNYYPLIMVNDTTPTPLHKDASTTSIIHSVPARNLDRIFIASGVKDNWIMTPSLLPLDDSRNINAPSRVLVDYPFSNNMVFIQPANYRVINHTIARVPHLYDSSQLSQPSQASINVVRVENNTLTLEGLISIPYLGNDAKVVLNPRLRLTQDGQEQILTAISTTSTSSSINLRQTNFGFTSTFNIPDVLLKLSKMELVLEYQSPYMTQTIVLPVVVNTTVNPVILSNNHRVSFNQIETGTFMNIELVTIEQGDMNQDGRISITDLVILHRLLLEIEPSTPILVSLGDMNQDGRISITDLVILHRKLLGLDN